ncbi:Major facilitator superfamily domain, general substrate transporter [Metarhizium album ARSEF 1941]|uniref:Major facilitator superfamily domain, general substrate transporter n=1 Tax=Metarhizium album (strain ARSEF 1941) TaxID=1081103 RepID=A0A0B2WNH6_METAS|nr:Major facilitator superfamily domain, general substrate transporter [Metarhizium album ARSEF 1941]KHN95042.1 Major facilitator superfamily domain, general substrate transporter [Metarhizium album ARSEF 1941]
MTRVPLQARPSRSTGETREQTQPSQPENIPVEAGDGPYTSIRVRRSIRTMNAAYDWTGPDDPDNPRNFPLFVRLLSAFSVTGLATVATVAGAMYAPAQGDVASKLNCSQETAVLPLSMYNLGLAFGPLVGAPLSETYGRKAVFLVTGPIFAAFMFGSGFSATLTGLIACRFFAGMSSSSLINNAPATILDSASGKLRGVSLSIYYTMPSFGAALGPLLGGFIVQAGEWQWTQWTAVFMAVGFYIPMCFAPETYKKVILRRRAIRLGLDTSSQRTSPGRAFRYFATVLIQRPLHMLFTEPIVTLISLYNGFLYGLLYTFVIAVPWIFREGYGFSKTGESLSYLGLMIGALAASGPLVFIDAKYYQKRLNHWRQSHPPNDDGVEEPLPSEHRLIGAMIGSLLLPAGLFISAWTAQYEVHWTVPIIFQGCVMLSSLLIYASATMFMLDAYGPMYAASASGAMMMSRYLLSAAFPLFALQMYKALGVGWATSVLGFVTVAMAPIPWGFWVLGERIRRRSKYETSM